MKFQTLVAATAIAVSGLAGAASAATVALVSDLGTNINGTTVGINPPSSLAFIGVPGASAPDGSFWFYLQNQSTATKVLSLSDFDDEDSFTTVSVSFGTASGDQNGLDDLELTQVLAAGESILFSVSFTGGDPDGRITGSFTVQPIPIPAAGFLLLAGLGGLAAVRRRKTA